MKIMQHDKTRYKDLPFCYGANLYGWENSSIKAYKCNSYVIPKDRFCELEEKQN